MKTIIGWSVCIMILSAIIISCQKNDTIVDNPPVEFVVRIDSVHLTKIVAQNNTLIARLLGRIGPSTCYFFPRYQEVARDWFRRTIKDYDANTQGSNGTSSIVELRSAIYRVFPIYPGKFTFIVQQPDGSTVQDTCFVI